MGLTRTLFIFVAPIIEGFWVKSYLTPHWPLSLLCVLLVPVNILLYFAWIVEIKGRFFSPLRHLPSPKNGSHPLIGFELDLITQPRGNSYIRHMNSTPNNGLIYLRGFRDNGTVLVTGPKALAEVLVTKSYDFQKGEKERGVLRKTLGDGLVVVEGDMHKFQRKHLQPSFSFRHIHQLYPTFWGKAVSLTNSIEKQTATEKDGNTGSLSGVTDIMFWAPKVSLDVIGIAGLGRDFNTLENSNDELARIYEEFSGTSKERTLLIAAAMVMPGAILNAIPWKLKQRYDTLEVRLRQICHAFIREMRLQKKSKEESFDILSQLIHVNEFSDQDLVNQVLTFLMAGHETTSSAFSWLIYLLAIHPSVQSRLREEIQTHVSFDNFTTPSAPDGDLASILDSLPLLNAVCNETLRLYPTVPITSRVSQNDTFIADTHIPKGTRVVLSPWAINRSRENWGDNAEEFIPDRWIDPVTGKANNSGGVPSNYANMTFLHGPRSCIGQGFAKAELKTLIAAFVGKFEFEMADKNQEVKVGGMVSQRPDGEVNVRFRGVDEW